MSKIEARYKCVKNKTEWRFNTGINPDLNRANYLDEHGYR